MRKMDEASAEKKGREEAGCDLCGKDGASVCCDCHCKQVVESRKEGWNEAIEAARKVAEEHRCTGMDTCCCDDEIAESINKLKRG